jgi:hypothetical protein
MNSDYNQQDIIDDINKFNIKVNSTNDYINQMKVLISDLSSSVQTKEVIESINNFLTNIYKESQETNRITLENNKMLDDILDFPPDIRYNYLIEIIDRLTQNWANKEQDIDSVYY